MEDDYKQGEHVFKKTKESAATLYNIYNLKLLIKSHSVAACMLLTLPIPNITPYSVHPCLSFLQPIESLPLFLLFHPSGV